MHSFTYCAWLVPHSKSRAELGSRAHVAPTAYRVYSFKEVFALH